jgi:hypothetical protein
MRNLIVGAGLAVILTLVVVGGVMAMSSSIYRLEWYTPLTGAGGGPSSSASYAVNFTVGQTAVNALSSSSYQAGVGYWQGAFLPRLIRLPLILRN